MTIFVDEHKTETRKAFLFYSSHLNFLTFKKYFIDCKFGYRFSITF